MKIKINKINNQCYLQKGFNTQGCYGCECNDSCCRFGADFDRESYDLVMSNKQILEKYLEKKLKLVSKKIFLEILNI